MYVKYCTSIGVTTPASKSLLGRSLYKLFPNGPVSRKQYKGIKTRAYHCLKLNTSDLTIANLNLVVPEFCTLSQDDSDLCLEIPTNETCDDMIVCHTFGVTNSEKKLSWKVKDIEINVRKYGLSDHCCVNQSWLDGIVCFSKAVKLCHGLTEKFVCGSSVPVIQNWGYIPYENRDSYDRTHSHKCEVVIPFNSPEKCNVCPACVQDLRLLRLSQKGKLNKVENNVSQHETAENQSDSDTCVCKCKKHKMSTSEISFNPYIFLDGKYHDDLINIIEILTPKAPQFKNLFRAQLCNATNVDPRQRRWDPAIISLALNLWAKCLGAYKDLVHCGVLVLPSQETLRLHKNVVRQTPGIVEDNLKWMLIEANSKGLPQEKRRGGILLDEMTIQHDLQVQRKGDEWELLEAIDLGEMVNNLESVILHNRTLKLATHVLVYMFFGYGGFRWPVAYYCTNNASAHQIYFTCFEVINKLKGYEFEVDYCMMDGSCMNRNFTLLMFPSDPRKYNFIAKNPYDQSKNICIIQDVKHCLKKVRNSILSSKIGEKCKRTLKLEDKLILWEQFQDAYQFNCRHTLKTHHMFRKNHFEPTQSEKMRNGLATDVLSSDMLNLMIQYQGSLENKGTLDSTIKFLCNTSELVNIFCEDQRPLDSLADTRIARLLGVLEFFLSWEKEYTDVKLIRKHLMSWQTRDDVVSTILAFVEIVKIVCSLNICVFPTKFNSDVIEGFFGEICSRNGQNQNPAVWQIGPSINTNLLTGNVISSSKNFNTGGIGESYKGIKPPPFTVFSKR